MVLQSALWTSGDLSKALLQVHYGASMTVTVMTFAATVLLREADASRETVRQILAKAQRDLREEMEQMQQKQDRVDERAAAEYSQTSASAQQWMQKVEAALQTTSGCAVRSGL